MLDYVWLLRWRGVLRWKQLNLSIVLLMMWLFTLCLEFLCECMSYTTRTAASESLMSVSYFAFEQMIPWPNPVISTLRCESVIFPSPNRSYQNVAVRNDLGVTVVSALILNISEHLVCKVTGNSNALTSVTVYDVGKKKWTRDGNKSEVKTPDSVLYISMSRGA